MTCKTLLALSLLGSLCVAGCGGSSSGGSTTTASPTITSVSVSCNPTSIQTGQTSQCSATVSGTGSYSSGVTWSATDGTTSSAGVFTPSAAGTATITATSTEDSTKSGSATVTVTVPVTLTSVSVACSPASILTTQTSTCTPTVTGTGSFSSSVSWSVSPSSLGTVSSSGVFTPSSVGTATITATSTQDSTKSGSATVSVSVPPSITSVATSCVSTTIQAGQTTQCSATVQGTGAYSQAVNWFVNSVAGGNSTVGTVSATGLYTAPSVVSSSTNTVPITAVSQSDSTKSGSATLTLVNPPPTLSLISPVSALAGSGDTNISVTGTGFISTSIVNLNSQALATTYESSTSVAALIPRAQLSSAGTATVSVTTPIPGGGTSSAAQFTITPVTAAASLVIMGTPAYSGSPNGPWLLSVAAVDSNGNPVPNLPITLNSSEGTITKNSPATNTTGGLSASIAPPATYAGEVVEVSAVSGSQTAVIDIVFAASSTTVGQQAAAALSHISSIDAHLDLALPRDSSGSSTSGSGINQLLVGTSNGSNTTNSFLGLQNTCTSNQGLDTTQSVDCQSEFSTKQIQLTPYSSASNKCSTLGSIEEVADCAGAAGTLVACASPESGIGELDMRRRLGCWFSSSVLSGCRDPSRAITCLQSIGESWSRNDLQYFHVGSRNRLCYRRGTESYWSGMQRS